MTTREDAIELGRDAMGRNDGWRWWAPRHLERLFLWEPIIRADEREWAAADARNRLRAQVKALLDVDRMTVEETGLGDDYWAGYDDAVADVIALLGGESE